tara:strand:- start:317 stop:613 length:297 start_codon:yes stop_codon:yes gene_type:complete
MSIHTHMLSEQNHRLAAKMLEQQGELNRAKARVAELEGELKCSRAEVERLRAWASSVRERAYAQPYSGARRECRFCGAMDHRPHDNDCLMLDESKEGG